jgi:hypothetical protein
MAYIGEPFRHDLFISYSHGAIDGSASSPLERWSKGFIRELESELRVHPKFGRQLALFFDDHARPEQGLDPMAGLTEQLRVKVGGAAILTVLMSDHYLDSTWCADERDWWVNTQAELGLAHAERIAVARIWPTSSSWPPALADERGNPLVGVCFYDKERAAERPQPYEWPMPAPESKGPFRERMLDLVGWLWRRIEQMKARMDERARAEQDAAKLAGKADQVLYLHGRIEQARAWEKANEALSATGFTVLPGEPDAVESDPAKGREVRRRRVETLSECDALLLLGTEDGRALDADLVVVGRGDRQSARALSNRLLPCGLLDTVGAPVATAQRKMAARGLQVDWLDSTREPWAGEVRQWLTQKSAAAGMSK